MDPRRKLKTFVVLVLAILANGAGNLCLSHGMRTVGGPAAWNPGAVLDVLGDGLSNPAVVAGSVLLLIFFALFLSLLSWADLSFILPMISLCFVVSALLGRLVLGETISPVRWMGIVLVSVGATLVGRTGAVSRTGPEVRPSGSGEP